MRFSFACLLPVAVAAVIPRDAALVLNTLKIIEASFSRDNLIADAADYDGSLLNTLLFQQQVDIITQLTVAVTNSLLEELPLEADVSAEVVPLFQTLAADIEQFLANIVAKEPNFDASPVTRPALANFLAQDRDAFIGYAAALTALVTADDAATAQAAADSITASFESALVDSICAGQTDATCTSILGGGL